MRAHRGRGTLAVAAQDRHHHAVMLDMRFRQPPEIAKLRATERLHPHVPKSVEIKEALGRLTPEERIYILARARMLASYSKAVEEAVGSIKA